MPPLIVDVMQRFKAQLLAREAEQMREMASRWRQVERSLDAEVEALARQMAEMRLAGKSVGRWRLARMDRYQTLLSQLRTETNRYVDYAEPLITNQQRILAQLGIDHSTTAIQTAYSEAGRLTAAFDQLPIEAVEKMVGATGNGSPLRTLLREAYPTSANGLTDLLIRNTALGRNPRETARVAMRDGLAQGLNRILVITRTEQLRVYRESSRANYERSGVVSQYMRLATHDRRVCPACLMADGQVFDVREPLSEHPQGRCTMIPLVDGLRAPTWQKGPDWFEEQPATVQREILGPGRYTAWRDGKFDLDQLVSTRRNDTWGDSLQPTALRDLLRGGVPRFEVGQVATRQTVTPQGSTAKAFETEAQAQSWGKSHYGQWAKDLSAAEVEAIKDYQHTAYGWVNEELRTGVGINAESRKYHRLLDGALRKMPLPERVIAYRGFQDETLLRNFDNLAGTIVDDAGYMSTSLSKKVAGRFLAEPDITPILADIIVPEGTNAAFLDAVWDRGETELLLGRGQKLRIVRAYRENVDVYGEMRETLRLTMEVMQ